MSSGRDAKCHKLPTYPFMVSREAMVGAIPKETLTASLTSPHLFIQPLGFGRTLIIGNWVSVRWEMEGRRSDPTKTSGQPQGKLGG